MLKILAKLFKTKSTKNPDYLSRGVIGPFGKYAWATYDLNEPSIDNANEIRLRDAQTSEFLCLQSISSDYEREFFYVILTSLCVTALFLDSKIDFKTSIKKWFLDNGKKYCIENYKCWPGDYPERTLILKEISPKEVFLYSYLSTLIRKKNYTVENTPKAIYSKFSTKELCEVYESLHKRGLLIKKKDNWIHSDSSIAIESREQIRYWSSLASFAVDIEQTTSNWKYKIDLSQRLGLKLQLQNIQESYISPCPACKKLSRDEILLNINYELLNPFHYNCKRFLSICHKIEK